MANIRAAEATSSGTNVTLTTTSETVVVTSPVLVLPADRVQLYILAWGQLTTGTGTTTVTPRIRRGTTTGGTLIGEANAEQVKAAAGSTEPFLIALVDNVTDLVSVQYVFTLQQAGATADGTFLQGSMLVLAF